MRLNTDRPIENVEDRRFDSSGRRRSGGRRGGPLKLGLGGLVILGILSLVFEQNFFTLLDGSGGDAGGGTGRTATEPSASIDPTSRRASPQEEQLKLFLNAVLAENQELWHRLVPKLGIEYQDTTLVLFTDRTSTACGYGRGATGPFYCPADAKVYIDMSFYDQLATRFGAPGDFAQAYVLAHEVAHHVQNVLGIDAQMRRLQHQQPDRANDLSVRLELQADCLAGVWGHSAQRLDQLSPGDVEEGLAAAAAVGDDRLQQQVQGYVQPDTFTHGTSRQRAEWFQRGFRTGDPDACDTFGASSL